MLVILSASAFNYVTFLVLCCCWVHNTVTCCCTFFIFYALAIFSTKGNFFTSFFIWFTYVSIVCNSSTNFPNSSSSINTSHVWETWPTTLAHNASIADFLLSVWVFFYGFYINAVIFPPLYFWPHIASGKGDPDASKILTPVEGTQHGPHKT